jgi:YHS domain-containing protein
VIAWLLRLIVAVLIVRAVWRFLAGVAQGLQTPSSTGAARGPSPVALARDPICGTYVVPARALTIGRGDEIRYFCSERCRDRYRQGRQLAS